MHDFNMLDADEHRVENVDVVHVNSWRYRPGPSGSSRGLGDLPIYARLGASSPSLQISSPQCIKWVLVLLLTRFQARPLHSHSIQDRCTNMAQSRILIDVRSPEEFATGKLGDAVNIPFQEIEERLAADEKVTPESPIVLYCRSGRRSAIAKTVLEAKGYQNVVDLGDMEAAQEALEKGASSQTQATSLRW